MISDMYKVMASLGHVTKVVYFDGALFEACCWELDMKRKDYSVRMFTMIDGAWVDIDDLEDEDEYYS